MSNQISSSPSTVLFQFRKYQVRTIIRDCQPWFVAKDICAALGITNNRDALSRVPDHHKGVAPVDSLGGRQPTIVVSEAGMYRLVLRSDKSEAEPFIEWVTSEVLPAIRKTGSFQAPALDNKPALPAPAQDEQAITISIVINGLAGKAHVYGGGQP